MIDTPAFMPVGTRATVKGLTVDQVRSTGAQIILANTYHLMLRPGPEVIAQLGGLHGFSNWQGPILTDSGGFQVFSLASLNKITDDGVVFQSHLDGARVELTPETSIGVQNQLGADIIMAFDECPALPSTPRILETSVERTLRWARRSRAAHRREDQLLYGIVQGGLDRDLRMRCVDALVAIGFDGYALGGLSVGEPPPEMWALLAEVTPRMPTERPRYLMGVGTPLDLAYAVRSGIDQFDCVLPTRNGRKGYAFTSQGVLRLRNERYKLDEAPVDPDCTCVTCTNHTRAYLRHLMQVGEVLGATLVSLHNLHYYQSLMGAMRTAIQQNRMEDWFQNFVERERQSTAAVKEKPCAE